MFVKPILENRKPTCVTEHFKGWK